MVKGRYSELGYISSNFHEISCEYNWVLSAKCGYQENKILPCEYQNFFFAVSISEKKNFAV